MAYVAVNEDGSEYIHELYPHREYDEAWYRLNSDMVKLPKGSIKKLIDRELTWEDEPVELTNKI